MAEPNGKEAWHLDKKVPIALIAAILFQTGGALVWAGAVTNRIDELEGRAHDMRGLSERVATVEAETKFIADSVRRIEQKIDKGQ